MAESQNTNKQTEAILHAQDYFQILRSRWKEALFVFILVFACCAVITYISTPMYKSRMTFEVTKPRETVNLVGGDNPVTNAASDAYMQTEFEAMVSERNLRMVAEDEHLDTEWGCSAKAAAGRLASMVSVMPRKGTNLVDVTATSSDPELSRRICERVWLVYEKQRSKEENSLIDDALAKRREELKLHSDLLDTQRYVLKDYISKGYDIDFATIGSSVNGPRRIERVQEEIAKYSGLVRETKREIKLMEANQSTIQGLEQIEQYIERFNLVTNKSGSAPKYRTLAESIKTVEDQIAQLDSNGYGPNHPHSLELKSHLARLQKDRETELVKFQVEIGDSIAAKKEELRTYEDTLKQLVEERVALLDTEPEVQEAIAKFVKERDFCAQLEKDIFNDEVRSRTQRNKRNTKQYSEADAATTQSSPNVKLNLTVGAIAGIIAGIVVAIIYNLFDTSVKSLEDAERQLRLPVLGVIPQDAGLLIQQDGESPDVEAYRILRTNIELKKALFKSRTYAVVSANAGEGKTTTLTNLAYVFAKAGCSTLMIDADMRRPRLARYALVDSAVGLSNYLTSDLELKDVVFKTTIPNLYILPSGPMPGDPSGVLSSYRMDQLLSEAAKRFDIVLFDSPPILGVSDASIIVSKVDATLVVIQPRKMPVKALLRTKSVIENVGGQIMGLIMNNVDISTDSQYQYYTTYYSYYSSDTTRKDKKMPDAKPAEKPEGGVPDKSVAQASASPKPVELQPAEPKEQDDSDLY